ncbi:MAG: phage portal protein, partial [Candidatus Peribacteraceae bacterium]|nr:phage portal protein [Candidatus Peribacteraceae bacterium]
MAIKKWIKDKFASTINYVTVRIGTGTLQWPISDEFLSPQAGKKDVNLATAIRLISDSIAGLPILVEEETIVEGKDTWETDADNPLNTLIQEPNPFHDKCDWVKHILQSLILSGNSYFFSFDDKELWPVPIGMMAPAISKETGKPVGYYWDPYGPKKKFYKIEEIFHIKLYDATTPFLGSSPTISVLEQMRSNKYAVGVNKNFFKNNATPGVLFEGDDVV